jgi:hypothetical protein
MSEFNLNETLKAAKVPERSDEYWEDFPGHVVRQLGRVPVPSRTEPSWFPRLAWGLAAATACLIVGFAVGHWRGSAETASANGLLQNGKLIRETMAMFPNRIRAIVQDERGLSLVLSEGDDVPVSPPLYIKVCDGKNCSALVTFSGQEVQMAGQKVMVLSDGRGGVILVGEKFLWSSDNPKQAANHLRIQATELGRINAG